MFLPSVTVLFAAATASEMVFLPVPPILEALILPFASTTAVPPITFATLFCAAYNWLPFTASCDVDEIAPAATLLMTLLPASIPADVTLGPPLAMLKPVLVKVLSPTVKPCVFKVLPPAVMLLATLMLSPKRICTWPFATRVSIFESAPTTSTASPKAF